MAIPSIIDTDIHPAPDPDRVAARLPEPWRSAGDETHRLRTIGDFIAGMTDRFAIARHEELVGPVNLPASRF